MAPDRRTSRSGALLSALGPFIPQGTSESSRSVLKGDLSVDAMISIMSLSCVMAFVPNTATAAFGSLAASPRSFEDALGARASEVFVAQVGLHVLVVSPGNLWDAPVLREEPDGAVVVIFSGDILELSTLGTRSRVRQFAYGKVVDEEGEPLGVELVFDQFDDPETGHLEVLCRLAGITRNGLRTLDWYALTPRWKNALARLFRN